MDRDEGVGWVGRRSFWRPQTAFCPYLGMKVFNQPPDFPAATSEKSNWGLPDSNSGALTSNLLRVDSEIALGKTDIYRGRWVGGVVFFQM